MEGLLSRQITKEQELLADSSGFFEDIVSEALKQKRIETRPVVTNYLVDLLKHYLVTENLFDWEDEMGRKRRSTLAELFLKSAQLSPAQRVETLKRLGDTSLYISGFFAQSLKRKVVDLSYYVEMGTSAYGALAEVVREESFSQVFSEMKKNFTSFVDAFAFISSKTMPQGSTDLMTLFNLYMRTGSEWARDQIISEGFIPPAFSKASGEGNGA